MLTAHRLIAAGLVALCSATFGCSGPTARSVPTSASPAAISAAAQPPPSPSAVPTGRLLWTAQAAPRAEMTATPDGYLLVSRDNSRYGQSRYEIYSLDRDGQQRWHKTYSYPNLDIDSWADVQTGASVVVLAQTNPARHEWPGSLIIHVLDSRTGRALWTDDQPSFLSVDAASVYTSLCHGGQNNHIGDCRLSARDPRTGHTRWSIPTYASAQVSPWDPPTRLGPPPVPPYLLVESFPTGFSSLTLTTVDPATGRRLGTSARTYGFPTAQALIGLDEDHNQQAQGCKTALTAWDPRGGGILWRRTIAGAPTSNGHCTHVDRHAVGDGQLAVIDSAGRTILISLRTGKTTWTAPEAGQPVLVDHDYVLTAGTDGTIIDHDRATNTIRWRTRNLDIDTPAAVRLGRWLLVYDSDADPYCPARCPTVVEFLDPATGSLHHALPGRYVAASSEIVITETQQTTLQASQYHAHAIT